VLLLIEVGETSVAYDRDVKIPLYAMAGIPEVWLLDLAESVVTVYREPWEGGYRERLRYVEGGERLCPGLVLGVALSVGDLLGG
jgi:Uma2 family endonuclease